jgi:hypothetical protein
MTNEHITEAQASEVWRRAAELQAEAERRREARALELPAPAAEGALPVTEVTAAAVEAGISPEFVRQAIAEVAHASTGEEGGPGAWLTDVLMGTGPRAMAATRAFAAGPAEALAAVQRVLPGHPYGFALVDSVGDPLAGGTLVLELTTDGMGSHPKLKMLSATGSRRVRLTIRPAAGGAGCEVDLVGELRASLPEPNTVGVTLVGFGAGGGGLMSALLAAKVVGLAGAVLLLPLGAGLALAGAATVAGHRAYYRWCLREGAKELAGILASIDAHIRTGGRFALPSSPGRDAGGADGGAVAVMISTL